MSEDSDQSEGTPSRGSPGRYFRTPGPRSPGTSFSTPRQGIPTPMGRGQQDMQTWLGPRPTPTLMTPASSAGSPFQTPTDRLPSYGGGSSGTSAATGSLFQTPTGVLPSFPGRTSGTSGQQQTPIGRSQTRGTSSPSKLFDVAKVMPRYPPPRYDEPPARMKQRVPPKQPVTPPPRYSLFSADTAEDEPYYTALAKQARLQQFSQPVAPPASLPGPRPVRPRLPPGACYITDPNERMLLTVEDRTVDDDWEDLWKTFGQFDIEHLRDEKYLTDEHRDFLEKMGLVILHQIGWGEYGTVYLAEVRKSDKYSKYKFWEKNQENAAVKVNSMGKYSSDGLRKAIDMMSREAHIIKELDHPNIVGRIGIFNLYDMESDLPFPVHAINIMELMDGNLEQYVDAFGQQDPNQAKNRKLTEEQAKEWFRQIVAGLQYMHDKEFAHCDIKLHNILYTESSPGAYVFKLTDFGMSMMISRTEEIDMNKIGSAFYQPPEARVVGARVLVYPCDIYALGVTLILTVAGMLKTREVWGARSAPQGKAQYAVSQFGCSQELGQLFAQMCAQMADQRPDITELSQHSYLR